MAKNPPIHRLRPPGKSVVATTWCYVDPYRKGVMTEIPGQQSATCKACLREEKKGDTRRTPPTSFRKANDTAFID